MTPVLRMTKNCTFFLLILSSIQAPAQQKRSAPNSYLLLPKLKNIVWGYYSSQTPPVMTIKSGDYVTIRTLTVGDPSLFENAGVKPQDIEQELRDAQTITDHGPGDHYLTGPIYISDAEPGDVLEVRIKSIEFVLPYGFTGYWEDFGGFLQHDIPGSKVKIIPLDTIRMMGHFNDSINIPLRPFFGSMAVAPPKEEGRVSSTPPGKHGGNMDNKELVAGTTLYLPVFVKGALFSVGDGHAAQGNGEVSIAAIETSLKGTFQFIVHKGPKLSIPRAETPTHFISMGFDKDLTIATKNALIEMIRFLMGEKHLSQQDSYLLCSTAVDFEITQLVDDVVGVHAMLPKKIFTKGMNKIKR